MAQQAIGLIETKGLVGVVKLWTELCEIRRMNAVSLSRNRENELGSERFGPGFN